MSAISYDETVLHCSNTEGLLLEAIHFGLHKMCFMADFVKFTAFLFVCLSAW